MKVIKPTSFTSGMLVSTTATDPNPAYAAGTTYAVDAIVSYSNRLYQSVVSSNTGNQPDISPAFWIDIGPTNPYGMFDRTVTYGTSSTETLTVVLTPGRFDSLALINLDCDLCSVTIRDGAGGPIIYENLIGLSGAFITDWSEYFFIDPLFKRTQVILSNLPQFANAHLTITLTGGTGLTISLGELIFGAMFEIGGTQYGASAGILDYSRKVTDDFGNVTFVERPFSKRINASVFVLNSRLNRVQQLMYSLRATPVVWIASESVNLEEALVVYGFYRDFSTDIAYPAHSIMSLEIEGLT